jgi:predicted Zn-dependent protease
LGAYLAEAPDSPDLKFQLAIVDFLENRYKESEVAFRELYQRYPTDIRLTYALAELLLRTNRQSDGLKLIQDAAAKKPSSRDLKMAVANTALRINQLDLAEKTLRELISSDASNADLYLRLGETLRRKGQMPAAVETLRKARQLSPNSAGANLQLAMTLDAIGSKGESLPLYETVIKAEPDNLIALNNIAFAYADSGKDLDLALTYAQRARKRAPNSEDVADTLAWVYIKKNLNDSAITLLSEITSKQPRNATYQYHLGVAMLQKGNKPAARQSFQTALSLKPSKDEETRIRELLGKLG